MHLLLKHPGCIDQVKTQNHKREITLGKRLIIKNLPKSIKVLSSWRLFSVESTASDSPLR